MVAAVAVESIIKLTAFVAVGLFVTYLTLDGLEDLTARLYSSPKLNYSNVNQESFSFVTWTTYLLLSMSAILFLPRQFHIAVVENSDEKHIKMAMWLFPLYLLLITAFVVPIALAGLVLDFPVQQEDK